MPAGPTAALSDSIGKTLGILEPPQGQPFASQVIPAAHDGFVDGFHVAAVVAAAVLLVGMVCVLPLAPGPGARRGAGAGRPARRGTRRRAPRRTGGLSPMTITPDAATMSDTVRRGRPRSAETEQAIVDAAMELLVEEGYGGMSMEGVATRARPARPRSTGAAGPRPSWWSTPCASAPPATCPSPTPATSGRPARHARGQPGHHGRPRRGAVMQAFAAEKARYPELRDQFEQTFIAERRAHLEMLVRRAMAHGELAADIDVDIFTSVGPAILSHHLLMHHLPAEPDMPRRTSTSCSRRPAEPRRKGQSAAATAGRRFGPGLAAEGLPEAGVGAVGVDQVLVGADLDDPALVHDHDLVGGDGGGEAVGDHQRGAAGGDHAHGLVDLGLAGEVEVGGGLVEQQDRRVDHLGPGEGEELALARRQRLALLADDVEVAAGQRGDDVVGTDDAGRGLDLGIGRVGPAVREVVADGAGEEERLLGHHAELVAVLAQVEVADVVPSTRTRPPSRRSSGRRASRASTCRPRSRPRSPPSRPAR